MARPSKTRAAPASLSALVRWAERRFIAAGLSFGHGTVCARDEAVCLVYHALGLACDTPVARAERVLSEAERARAAALVELRITTRKPAPYLTGEAWFAGLPFHVDERVIVPRSPMAELIDQRFRPWIESPQRVLDLCTGSGCIAVACALALPGARVDASDVSADALTVAARNVARHGVTGSVRLIQSDLFSELSSQRYELIISNPPYVPSARLSQLPPEYRHEPGLALDGARDGLAIAARIIDTARAYLSDNGVLIVEVGEGARALERRYPHLAFTWLEFERGEDGVFLLDAAQLRRAAVLERSRRS
ncbi:MAG: 50S ribosomal protein L3 N(5)-glutamine methyltransferase [Gammaproteobacteria bacterium]